MGNLLSLFSLLLSDYIGEVASYSTLREYLIAAAGTLWPRGIESTYVVAALDAMGFWTGTSVLPFSSDGRPDAALHTVNGVARRYFMYTRDGVVYMRFRECPLPSTCNWSAEAPVMVSSSGFSLVESGANMWFAFEFGGNVYTSYMNSAGVWSPAVAVGSLTTNSRPQLLVVGGAALRVYVRDAAPFTTTASVRSSDWNGFSWSTPIITPIRSRTPLDAANLGDITYVAYRRIDNNPVYRIFHESTSVFGYEKQIRSGMLADSIVDPYGPAVALFKGSVHFMWAYRVPFLGGDYYGSAPWGCEDPLCWSRFSPIDGLGSVAWLSLAWVDLSVLDAKLVQYRQRPTPAGTPAFWRRKNSQ